MSTEWVELGKDLDSARAELIEQLLDQQGINSRSREVQSDRLTSRKAIEVPSTRLRQAEIVLSYHGLGES